MNYTDMIVEALDRYPDREAFVFGARRVTYRQASRRIGRFMHVLAARGIMPGSAIAVLSSNVPEVWMAQAAIYLLGARFSGLHPLGAVDDYAYICDHAAVETLIVHPDYMERAHALAARAPSIRNILSLGASDGAEDLLELSEAASDVALRRRRLADDDVHWIAYTGGTTGRSKGVEIPDRALVQQVQTVISSLGLPERPRFLAVAPISHAGILPILPTLLRGGTVILQNGFNPQQWLKVVQEEQVNWSFIVPTMLYALLDSGKAGGFDLTSLETLMYGSSPMSPTRIAEAHELLGPVLLQAYGQTECVSFATTLRKDEHDPLGDPDLLRSCGRPVIGMRVDILDQDNQPVGVGDVGEICVRGAGVMRGYHKMPDETAEALSGDWLHTGDLAMRDDRGFLYIVDRKKDMIVTGGFNVYPKEIEDVIATLPEVSMVAVIGVPDDKWGEAVKAVVVARPGARVDAQAIIDIVRQRKGAHQTPKSVEVVESLPVTSVGKVDKKVIRAAYWDGRERMVN
ncbi:AMP-binding protein [Caulobacter soli]|uniref:AMP-binding protein n=1 Tax=Caulobacter soli TaxID=2708539 RepID=UPI001FE287F6|nr:AMP-binding protein [Caulobacter soli]